MVGYSETPLAKKLGITEGARVLTIAAPAEFPAWLEPMPDDVLLSSRILSADVVMMFCVTELDLTRGLERALGAIGPEGSVWLCWPKKASGIQSPLQSRDITMGVMLPTGLVDIKVSAISEVW